MTSIALADVNWEGVAAEVLSATGYPADGRRQRNDAMSLCALYVKGFETGSECIRAARSAEPLNPLHALRDVLHLIAFGQLREALRALDELTANLEGSPIPEYLRGLIAIRRGRPDQAGRIAVSLEREFPDFTPVGFLKAEAQVLRSSRLKKLEKYLRPLPTNPEWEPLWADLLAKIVLLHGEQGVKEAGRYLDKALRKGSAAHAAVEEAIAWGTSSQEELASLLAGTTPGSRGEEIVLARLVDELDAADDDASAVDTITQLLDRYPERDALRQLQVNYLTRVAIEEYGKGRYHKALRLVDACLRKQPHASVHYQNRAALFSMLRERRPYHESWAEFDRQQIRLALLGRVDQSSIAAMALSHRLFAQEARLDIGVEGRPGPVPRGIFFAAPLEEGLSEPRWEVNNEGITRDPELLRQWLHHRRAELFIRHWALGSDPDHFLLYPQDRDDAGRRLEALGSLAESMAIVVPDEGRLLADQVIALWNEQARAVRTRYAPRSTEPAKEIRDLEIEHLETLGDLCVLCFQWLPDFRLLPVAEELLEYVRAETALLNEQTLFALRRERGGELSYPLRVLTIQLNEVTGVEDTGKPLDYTQRLQAVDAMIASLLQRMSVSAYEGGSGSPKDRAESALPYLDRARQHRPDSAAGELSAVRLLAIGEFYEEAWGALTRFRHLVEPEQQELLTDAEELTRVLKEVTSKGQAGRRREGPVVETVAAVVDGDRIAALDRELEQLPGTVHLYEEIAQELIRAGRFDEAAGWSGRAIGHCLSRAGQIGARALDIEVKGLQLLSTDSPRAVDLYLSGAHAPAREAVEGMRQRQPPDYSLLFLLGRCQLAEGQPDEARRTFEEALTICERQFHQAVLRHLAGDIDRAYLVYAREELNEQLHEGQFEQALEHSVRVFGRLREPTRWLLDLGRLFYETAAARLGSAAQPLSVPAIPPGLEFAEALNAALREPDDLSRAESIVELAAGLGAKEDRRTKALRRKIQSLRRRLVVAEELRRANELLRERRFEEVLALFQELEEYARSEPRLIRTQVLALLGLQRFDKADAAFLRLASAAAPPAVQQFISDYPGLVLRNRLRVAHDALRSGRPHDATSVLDAVTAPTAWDRREVAYCLAFAATLEAIAYRRSNDRESSRRKLLEAIDLLDPHLNEAAREGQPYLGQLLDRVERDLERI